MKGEVVRPSEVLQKHRGLIRQIIEQGRLRNPRVFGSALRGDDQEGGDLDLLVDPDASTTPFDLGGVQCQLEELLGVRVHLLTARELPPRVRARVLRDAEPL